MAVSEAEAEKIKKRLRRLRRGNSTQTCTKKGLNDQKNCNGVVTHLEPNTLKCEVKWVLEVLL